MLITTKQTVRGTAWQKIGYKVLNAIAASGKGTEIIVSVNPDHPHLSELKGFLARISLLTGTSIQVRKTNHE